MEFETLFMKVSETLLNIPTGKFHHQIWYEKVWNAFSLKF